VCIQSKTINDFNFDAWKKRYSDWNQLHYRRLTDVFRHTISSRAQTLTRKEFIDGILSTSTYRDLGLPPRATVSRQPSVTAVVTNNFQTETDNAF